MLDFTTDKDIKDFFKKKIILISAIATTISVLVTFLIIVLSGQMLSFSVQNVFFTLLSFDVFSMIYAVSMYLFYFKSRRGEDLKFPSKLLWITSFVQVLFVLMVFAILFIGALSIKMQNELVYQVLVFFCVLLEIYLLPQCVFSYSIRNYVNKNKKTYIGAGLASFLNYLVAYAMFVPIFSDGISIWNVIIMCATTLSYLCKGIVCSKYKKFVKNPYLTRTLFTSNGGIRRLERIKRG